MPESTRGIKINSRCSGLNRIARAYDHVKQSMLRPCIDTGAKPYIPRSSRVFVICERLPDKIARYRQDVKVTAGYKYKHDRLPPVIQPFTPEERTEYLTNKVERTVEVREVIREVLSQL